MNFVTKLLSYNKIVNVLNVSHHGILSAGNTNEIAVRLDYDKPNPWGHPPCQTQGNRHL